MEDVRLEDERDEDDEADRVVVLELDEVEELRTEEDEDVGACVLFTVVEEERVVIFGLDEVEELRTEEDEEVGVCVLFTVVEEERVAEEDGCLEELLLCTADDDVRVEEEVVGVVLFTVDDPEFISVEVALLDDELEVRVGVVVERSTVLLLLSVTGVELRCVVFTRFVVVVLLFLVEVDTRDGCWFCEAERVSTAFLLVFSSSKDLAFLTDVFLREKLFSG